MAEIQHLHDLADERVRDKSLLAEVGAMALCDVAMYGEDAEQFDPGVALLRRVVQLDAETPGVTHGAAYYMAQNHLAHAPLYRTVAAGEIIPVEQLTEAQRQLTELLRVSRADTNERTDATGLAQLTFQAMLLRRRDPGHVAFPAPPTAAWVDFWDDGYGNTYPRSNVFATANNGKVPANEGRYIPTQVRPSVNSSARNLADRYPWAHVVGMGQRMSIGMKRYDRADYRDFVLSTDKIWRSVKALLKTADFLLAESEGEELTLERQIFLTSQSDFLVKKLDETALPAH